MNGHLQPLLGTDTDLVSAQVYRHHVLTDTITTVSNRLSELADQWQATVQRLGKRRSAADDNLGKLRDQEQKAAINCAALTVSRDTLQAKANQLWPRFVRFLKSFAETAEPLEIDRQLKSSNQRLAAANDQLETQRRLVADADRHLARLNAPFEDIEFAQSRLQDDLAGALLEQQQLRQAIRDAFVRAVCQRPLWSLAEAATTIPELELASLLACRRRWCRASVSVRRAAPPPLPGSANNLPAAVRSGFYNQSRRGSGSLSVTGHGSTRVRRTRWVTDSKGRSRSESYWTTVSVRFRGSVKATYSLQYRRWRPRALGDAFPQLISANLDSPEPLKVTIDDPTLDHLIDVCGLRNLWPTPEATDDGQPVT